MRGLAYEIVINSIPCIAYLMEENTMPMQALVIAHASYGHNSFFKGNYLFRQWTSADAIIDYMVFARQYVRECEEKHGVAAVEELLDAAHALMDFGINRYRHPKPLSPADECAGTASAGVSWQQYDEIWRTLPANLAPKRPRAGPHASRTSRRRTCFTSSRSTPPSCSPGSVNWCASCARWRSISIPQGLTKVMNEGWATFWHYTCSTASTTRAGGRRLHDRGAHLAHQRGDPARLDQPATADQPVRARLRDVHRHPPDLRASDARTATGFPTSSDTDWRKVLDFAMRNYKDESFIAQFLRRS
jgi:stage V sporulation protein R